MNAHSKIKIFSDKESREMFAAIIVDANASAKLKLKAKFALFEFDRGIDLQIPSLQKLLRYELIEEYEGMLVNDNCPGSLVPEIMNALAELYIEEALQNIDTRENLKKAFEHYQIILTSPIPSINDKLKAQVGLALLERLEPSFRNLQGAEKSAEPRLARTDSLLANLQELERYFNNFPDQPDQIFSGPHIKVYKEKSRGAQAFGGNRESECRALEDILGDADFCPYRINEVRFFLAKAAYFGLPSVPEDHYRCYFLLNQIISDTKVNAALKGSAELLLARLYLFSEHYKNLELADLYLKKIADNQDALKEDRKLANVYLASLSKKRKAEVQDDKTEVKRLRLND